MVMIVHGDRVNGDEESSGEDENGREGIAMHQFSFVSNPPQINTGFPFILLNQVKSYREERTNNLCKNKREIIQ